MHEKDTWHRKEFQGREDEIESRREYEERHGLKDNLLSTRFRDYADRAPEVVMERWRSGSYPEKTYVTAELDTFLESIKGRSGQRTPLEVKASDVARYERGVQAAEDRVKNRQEDLDRAVRYLNRQRKNLETAKNAYALEQALGSN